MRIVERLGGQCARKYNFILNFQRADDQVITHYFRTMPVHSPTLVKSLEMMYFRGGSRGLPGSGSQFKIRQGLHTERVPIFAIDRLRMGTDGPGVTTLVAFMGCPLKCRYCLNARCNEPVYEADGRTPRRGILMLSPQELYERVKIDNIYFQATGGGICFGGGEPGLRSDFIAEFRELCGDRWKITVETSGYMSWAQYERLAPVVDLWIVDIKTLNSCIYQEYTGRGSGVRQHLECLRRLVDMDKVIIKVPHIPDFTTDEDVLESISLVKELGFPRVQEFAYIKRVLP